MKTKNLPYVVVILVLLGTLLYWRFSLPGLIVYAFILLLLEITSYFLVRNLRKSFPWLITPEDEHPAIDTNGLDTFLQHGFDPELGWVRKANTEKEEMGKYGTTKYNIDEEGRRKNPGHENFPAIISCYGDSFTFARQVNDNETWEWHLSELTKTNVINLGVGNYGLDQALLHVKRDYNHHKTKIVIMGVVPSTIVRILSLWKHYHEFGNTFAFKPRFKRENDQLSLMPNIMTDREKFLSLEQYLPYFRQNDYLYHLKFRQDMIYFPYFISILCDPQRNFSLIYHIVWSKIFEKGEATRNKPYPTPMKVIMDVNLRLRYHLFTKNKYAVSLLTGLVQEFVSYGKEQGFTPVFLLMPQKDDVTYVQKKGKYYQSFLEDIRSQLLIIDATDALLSRTDLDDLYSDDNRYGGHYSKKGNELIAAVTYKALQKKKLVP